MGHRGFAALTFFFLFHTWFSWKNDKLEEEILTRNASSAPATTTHSTVDATSIARSNTNVYDSQHPNIEATLRIVAQLGKITDVNGDGLYNCIDAAVLFYKYYPIRDRVAIIINVNPRTGMNHLFNAVLINGTWIAIEPQAYATNHRSYRMKDVWGNQYDNSYNRVATETYARFAR